MITWFQNMYLYRAYILYTPKDVWIAIWAHTSGPTIEPFRNTRSIQGPTWQISFTVPLYSLSRHDVDLAWQGRPTRRYLPVAGGRVNTLRPRQDVRHFADDTFKRILFNENVRISIKISLKFVAKSPNNNIPALVLIMAWRRRGDKPLSEPMVIRSSTHICVSRPQWVKCSGNRKYNFNTLYIC